MQLYHALFLTLSILHCGVAIPIDSEGIALPDAVPPIPPRGPILRSVTSRGTSPSNDYLTWENVLPPSAINPIYINQTDPDIWLKRDESGPLYGSSGKPELVDVHQTTNPSCGFASSLAAVVHVASGWISSKITHSDDLITPEATVDMYNPQSLAPQKITIQHGDTATKSDIDPATGIWWPGLYDHAAIKLGMDNVNGALGPILPAHGLSAITGKKAKGDEIKGDVEKLWGVIKQQQEKNTPMVVQTVQEGAKVLVGRHAYAILGTSGSGADRKVTLYNPWGTKSTESLAAITPDAYYIWYLENFDTWEGGDPESEPTPQKEEPAPEPTIAQAQPATVPAPTITEAPQPTSTRVNWGDKKINAVTVDAADKKKDDHVVWVTEVVTVVVHA